MKRAFFALAIVAVLAMARAQSLGDSRHVEIFESVWKAFNEKFYDPNFNGVNWSEVRERYLPKVKSATSHEEIFRLLRAMLSELKTSQTIIMSTNEMVVGRGILPFAFERIDGRYFVTYVYPLRNGTFDLKLGDEILEVDGMLPTGMEMDTLKHNVSFTSNPYYGQANATSTLTIRREGKGLRVSLPRVPRFRAIKGMTHEKLSDIGYLRLHTLGSAFVDVDEMLQFFSEMKNAKGMIIDLRYTGPGDIAVALTLASLVSPPNVTYCYYITRKGREEKRPTVYSEFPPKASALEKLIHEHGYVRVQTTDTGRQIYRGPLAVLVNAKTEADGELLAAFLQHSKRATLIGEATTGTSGVQSEPVLLPYNAGYVLVPTREVRLADGKRLEATGLKPDIVAKHTIESLSRGKDAVLEQARRLFEGKRN